MNNVGYNFHCVKHVIEGVYNFLYNTTCIPYKPHYQ